MHEIETKMDTPVTPSIGLFHADKQTVEALGPVVQLAKSGFFYCTQGEMSLVLGNRAFEIHRGDIYIYPPLSKTYIRMLSDDLHGTVGVADFDFVFTLANSISNTQNHLYMRENPCISLNDEQRRRIEELIMATHGHALVLFTSYSLMGEVHTHLQNRLPFPLLEAWRNGHQAVRLFKNLSNAVLFAAGPCWEGMDFPGDMVSLLVIARLPFPVPDPVSEAERKQYHSLQEYIRAVVLPDMQSKLRQGFGRAIRTETDTCVVAVLDRRAAEGQRYHAAVLEALPKCRLSDSLEDVARFIRERKTLEYFQQ